MITFKNRDGWQKLANEVEENRPSVGKRVLVEKGRSHKGKSGTVVWHGRDEFFSKQYLSDSQRLGLQMMGRDGYRVGIQTNSGEKFFVSAEYVKVLEQANDR